MYNLKLFSLTDFWNGSWKTTTLGFLQFAGVAVDQAVNLLDDDTATIFSWKILSASAAAFVALWKARDNDKSSESVKAK